MQEAFCKNHAIKKTSFLQASSIALVVAASIMLHKPENYITEWANGHKSDALKQVQIDEVGENGIERE